MRSFVIVFVELELFVKSNIQKHLMNSLFFNLASQPPQIIKCAVVFVVSSVTKREILGNLFALTHFFIIKTQT